MKVILLKGVKNVGPTSSRPLIAHYGSIEEIYKNIELKP